VTRFVLHPGYVTSPNDGDRHYIGARQLADLYGVRLSECVVIDPERPRISLGHGDLSAYLHLFPSAEGAAYWRISETERAQYPITDRLPQRAYVVRRGTRRFSVLRATLREVVEVARGL
jgi:hypothetical protein